MHRIDEKLQQMDAKLQSASGEEKTSLEKEIKACEGDGRVAEDWGLVFLPLVFGCPTSPEAFFHFLFLFFLGGGGDGCASKSSRDSIFVQAREKQLLPLYTSVATTFADLHDRAGRMKAKGVIREGIAWKAWERDGSGGIRR